MMVRHPVDSAAESTGMTLIMLMVEKIQYVRDVMEGVRQHLCVFQNMLLQIDSSKSRHHLKGSFVERWWNVVPGCSFSFLDYITTSTFLQTYARSKGDTLPECLDLTSRAFVQRLHKEDQM